MSALFIGGLNLFIYFVFCAVGLQSAHEVLCLSQEDYLKLSATKTV